MINKGIYQHYKGSYYEVIDVATHSETLDKMVIYKPVDQGNDQLWVRPLTMFTENVFHEDKEMPRFKFIR